MLIKLILNLKRLNTWKIKILQKCESWKGSVTGVNMVRGNGMIHTWVATILLLKTTFKKRYAYRYQVEELYGVMAWFTFLKCVLGEVHNQKPRTAMGPLGALCIQGLTLQT